jgi:hypothetical protein
MDILPALQQESLLPGGNAHRSTNLVGAHRIGPDQGGGTIGTDQVDLGLAIPEAMNVGRQRVVNENHYAQTVDAQLP